MVWTAGWAAVLLSAAGTDSAAQDSSSGDGGHAPSEQVFHGMFTPQPQYPTPGTTLMNPDAVPQDKENPFKGLFTPQPQYPTPQATVNTDAAPPAGANPLKGMMTPQPQYPTPQTLMNNDPEPQKVDPQKGFFSNSQILSPGAAPNAGVYDPEALFNPPADGTGESQKQTSKQAPAKPEQQPAAAAQKKKDTKKKDKNKKSASGEEKDKDKEKGDDKDKDKSDKDAMEVPPRALPYSPLRQAILLLNAGQYDRSMAVLTKVLEGNPSNAEAHYLKGVLLVMIRRYPEAAQEYRAALKLTHDDSLAARATQGLKKIGQSAH